MKFAVCLALAATLTNTIQIHANLEDQDRAFLHPHPQGPNHRLAQLD
jgi:hypothetical protein